VIRRILFYIVLFAVGICLQVMWPMRFAPFNVGPHFLLILTIYIALMRGPLVGETMGFLWGLSADGISVTLFGSQAFLLTLIGFISGKMSRNLDESKPWAQIIFILAMSVMYFGGLYALFRIFIGADRRIGAAFLVVHPIINALLAPVVFWLVGRGANLWFSGSVIQQRKRKF